MRIILLVLCAIAFASSAAAIPPPQCKYLDKRLAYYQSQLERAQALDSAIWEARLETYIDQLDDFRDSAGCPDNSTVLEQVARTINKILEAAAQGAITFFTMGAGGV